MATFNLVFMFIYACLSIEKVKYYRILNFQYSTNHNPITLQTELAPKASPKNSTKLFEDGGERWEVASVEEKEI